MNELDQLEQQIEMLKRRHEELKQEKRKAKRREIEKMTTAEKWAAVMKMPPLTDELYDLLENQGFQTGSDVYSDAVPEDYDWCIMVPPSTFEGHALGTDADYWVEDGMSPLYAHYHGNRINIICMSDAEMWDAWYMATEIMQQLRLIQINRYRYNSKYAADNFHAVKETPILPLEHSFNVKWNRVAVFRALKEVLWPVRERSNELPLDEALEHHACIKCHRKAEMFTCMPMREQWQKTGICERCEPSLLDPKGMVLGDEYER